ncbi:nicotinate-nucleotide pyrophosphorylase [Planctomycetaceae bacterium SCGC AG-212-F19]|nr:nicotinate-nucleotide pyrophosphorylase [Planctomycetaceae bacterium SCGC AG-212-F19]
MSFNPAETAACRHLIGLALAEDLDTAGDLTSEAVIPATLRGQAVFIARSPGILAGLEAGALVLEKVHRRKSRSANTVFQPFIKDGWPVDKGTTLARVAGPMRDLLMMERTALNFMQRLSGVATQTRRYVDAVAGLKAQILDTRKTTPGWRLLEKYAVRQGGGHNHRIGLFDGILIKDNHLAALSAEEKGEAIKRAVELARATLQSSGPTSIEIEVDTLDQLDAALAEKPDIILVDNMTPDVMREAVRRRDRLAPGVLLEASGGVNLQTVRPIAETGVDRISVGALTHSAPALDIALDYLA